MTGSVSVNIIKRSGSSGIVLNLILLVLHLGVSMFLYPVVKRNADNMEVVHKEGCRFLSISYRREAEEPEVLVS